MAKHARRGHQIHADGNGVAWKGALAGMAGTAAMTAMAKGVAPRVMPREMRPDEFAPRRIVEWAEERTAGPGTLGPRQETAAAMAAHFGYGTTMGALYARFRERVDGPPAPVAGALFGLGLWAFGFEGWMPTLGIQPATTEKPPRKRLAPIMMHLVYGTTTAVAYELLARRR